MVTVGPSDRPDDDVVSYMMDCNLFFEPHTLWSSFTFLQKKTNFAKKRNASEKTNIRLPPPPGQNVFSVYFEDGPHNGRFFSKTTYCVSILIGVTRRTL